MIENYFKVAWRNLIQKKSYSLLNLGALAIGMACSILILLWVQNELSYDEFHENSDHMYRLTSDAGGGFHAAVSPAGMRDGLPDNMPEIKAVVRLFQPESGTTLLNVGNKRFEEKRVFYTDPDFLEMFSFPLLKGNSKTALSQPDGILITETTARKYFGDQDAVGQIIRLNNSERFTVTGVLADIPVNSHIQFDVLLPIQHLVKSSDYLFTYVWQNFNFYSYVQLDESTIESIPIIEEKINQIYTSHVSDMNVDFHLQPLADIHLHSDLQIDVSDRGNIQYVNIFLVIAFIILIVACINFMNLATARSARRSKEVGLRKVVGAGRQQLVMQFLSESMLISFLALIFAIGLVFLLLPTFNEITGKQLEISLLDIKLVIGLAIIAMITGLIAGSYPALFLSSFRPVSVLKGKLKLGNRHSLFRNILVICQFAVSLLLLVGTAVIYTQLNFIKDKNLGFEQENLLYVTMTGDLGTKRKALETALQQNPLTAEFSIVSDLPTNLATGNIDIQWDGKDPDMQKVIQSMRVDDYFLDVFKVKVLNGRGFSKDLAADSTNYLINEKAANLMGMNIENAVGQNLTFAEEKGKIIGVVKDFNFRPLQYGIEPLILRWNRFGGFAVVRTQASAVESTIHALEQICADLNPAYPLSYGFLNKDLENQYQSEQQMGTIFNIFAVLAIFISCLGLYGLSAFMAEQRVKEIGIRKVLGASVLGLVNMLSKDFLKLILIALLIAVPVAWYVMNLWLQNYAYHITIQWWMFVFAGLVVLFIAVSTISFQTIKAANTSPIKSIRTE